MREVRTTSEPLYHTGYGFNDHAHGNFDNIPLPRFSEKKKGKGTKKHPNHGKGSHQATAISDLNAADQKADDLLKRYGARNGNPGEVILPVHSLNRYEASAIPQYESTKAFDPSNLTSVDVRVRHTPQKLYRK